MNVLGVTVVVDVDGSRTGMIGSLPSVKLKVDVFVSAHQVQYRELRLS